MKEILRDLFSARTTETSADKIRAAFRRDNYGTEWCLTDILRIDNRHMRGTILDALIGLQRGSVDPSLRLNLNIRIRSVSGKPFDVYGYTHDAPDRRGVVRSRRAVVDTYEAEFSAPFVADTNHSAMWLLNKYGWCAKDAGREKRRYATTYFRALENGQFVDKARTDDTWTLVEVAFEKMHPELAPPKPVEEALPLAQEPELQAAEPVAAEVKSKSRARRKKAQQGGAAVEAK